MRRLFMLAATVVWLVIATSASFSQTALPRDAVVAVYAADESEETKPYLFYDLSAPISAVRLRGAAECLTTMFCRMTRATPDFKGKTAVRSACVGIVGFDNDT